MKLNFLSVSLILILLIAVFIIIPFWKPIIWGIVLSIVFFPAKVFINKIIKNDLIASLLVLILMVIVVMVPFLILIVVSGSQINAIIEFISNALKSYSNTTLPYIGKLSYYLNGNLQNILTFASKNALNIFSYTYKTITDIIFAFLVGFYLIKDKDKFLAYIEGFVKDKGTFQILIDTIRQSLKATLVGGLTIALLQGFLIAVGFLIAGIGGFFIWIIVGAIVSFVPMVGTALVWLPAGVYFLLIGSYFKGVFLIIWGGIFVGSVDNYIRPLLIGSYMNIHPLLLFFSIMGGVVLFGLVGLLVGPIVVSLADASLSVYKNKILDK